MTRFQMGVTVTPAVAQQTAIRHSRDITANARGPFVAPWCRAGADRLESNVRPILVVIRQR